MGIRLHSTLNQRGTEMYLFIFLAVFIHGSTAFYQEHKEYEADELKPLNELVQGIKNARGSWYSFDATFREAYCYDHLLCNAALWYVCENGGGKCETDLTSTLRNGIRKYKCKIKVTGCSRNTLLPRKSLDQVASEVKAEGASLFHIDDPKECYTEKFCGLDRFRSAVTPFGGGYYYTQLTNYEFYPGSNKIRREMVHGCAVRWPGRYQHDEELHGFLTPTEINRMEKQARPERLVTHFKTRSVGECRNICYDPDICNDDESNQCWTSVRQMPNGVNICTINHRCYTDSWRRRFGKKNSKNAADLKKGK